MPWISVESAPLTLAQMQNNAQLFRQQMENAGWTINAICGILGNMQAESTINPGRWEDDTIGSGGFGLVQWTPASKVRNWILSYFGSTDYTNGTYQTQRIIYEFTHGEQYAATSSYPLSAAQFRTSVESAGYLARAFLYNYERPADPAATANFRARQAAYWWEYLTGTPPGPDPGPGGHLPPWLYFKLRRR